MDPSDRFQLGSMINVCLASSDHIVRFGLAALLGTTQDLKVVGDTMTGPEAVELVENTRPDLIVMNVATPLNKGIDAAKRILRKFKHCKVLMLLDNADDLSAASTANAHGYSLTSAEPSRLFYAIRSVASGEFWLDPLLARKMMDENSSHNSMHHKQQHNTGVENPNGKGQKTGLSSREIEVLRLMAQGLSNREIAAELVISIATAKTHVRNILEKLCAHDRTEAAVRAFQLGIVNAG